MAKKKQKGEAEERPEAAPGQAAGKPEVRLPILLEMALTLSRLLILLAGVSAALLSLKAGAGLPMAIARGGAALLISGLLLWLVNWMLARRSLEAVIAQLEQAGFKHPGGNSVDKEA